VVELNGLFSKRLDLLHPKARHRYLLPGVILESVSAGLFIELWPAARGHLLPVVKSDLIPLRTAAKDYRDEQKSECFHSSTCFGVARTLFLLVRIVNAVVSRCAVYQLIQINPHETL
jgi:hypothetical protein